MNDIETFSRDAAQKRGMDPDTVVRVEKSEGGVEEYAQVGKFATGWSWWPLQLHYGGTGYEQFGTTAGMGTGFTELTGWAPGDPRAWRDSIRYALNRARVGGWGPWYGARAIGITGFDGIDRTHPWDANAETWDYETGVDPVPAPTYNPDTRLILQNDDWSCWDTSARMGVESLGRHPTESWFESQSIADGVESTAVGLEDGTGAAGAAWLTSEYSDPSEGTPTLKAVSAASVSFDDVRSVAGTTAVLLGGHRWGAEGHWTFVRRYDPVDDLLELGNPAGTYAGIGQTMTRQQFAQIAPAAMVVIRADGAPVPPPVDPFAEIRTRLARIVEDANAIGGLLPTAGG